jgi:cytochrome o ubiquinol oxidase subunit 2
MTVEVVALDWKWLFFYPELGIATVNEMAAPVDVPINFKITSSSVMNSFYVPALAGQIYAMPGMQTRFMPSSTRKANLTACPPTTAAPASPTCASSSTACNRQGFDQWVAQVKAPGHGA